MALFPCITPARVTFFRNPLFNVLLLVVSTVNGLGAIAYGLTGVNALATGPGFGAMATWRGADVWISVSIFFIRGGEISDCN